MIGGDSFGRNNFQADDALSTVSAPSRFTGAGVLGGGGGGPSGLFTGLSALYSQATTPRGSDNTSNSDRLDWPPPSQSAANCGVGNDGHSPGNRGPIVFNGGVLGKANPGYNAIDDTFTDDSNSEESHCLADATMKNVDRPANMKKVAANNGRGRRRRRGGDGRAIGVDDGGHFMKVVAVVSVVANVVLAFYLGTTMRS